MYILALTGSIATGKSTVLEMFKQQNIAAISSDEIVHELYQNEAVAPIKKLFPNTIDNNVVDRKKLTTLLLKQPKSLKKLEKIIHPLVLEKQLNFIKEKKTKQQKLIIIEIPLLFESNNKKFYHGVVLTTCPKEILRKRALKREGMSEEKLNMILANQMTQAKKIALADFIIDSSKTLEETKIQVKNIIQKILNKSEK